MRSAFGGKNLSHYYVDFLFTQSIKKPANIELLHKLQCDSNANGFFDFIGHFQGRTKNNNLTACTLVAAHTRYYYPQIVILFVLPTTHHFTSQLSTLNMQQLADEQEDVFLVLLLFSTVKHPCIAFNKRYIAFK